MTIRYLVRTAVRFKVLLRRNFELDEIASKIFTGLIQQNPEIPKYRETCFFFFFQRDLFVTELW
jgi:hypothetical protein